MPTKSHYSVLLWSEDGENFGIFLNFEPSEKILKLRLAVWKFLCVLSGYLCATTISKDLDYYKCLKKFSKNGICTS